MRITKSCISTDRNELRVDMLSEIRTHEGHAGTSPAVACQKRRRWRGSIGGSDFYVGVLCLVDIERSDDVREWRGGVRCKHYRSEHDTLWHAVLASDDRLQFISDANWLRATHQVIQVGLQELTQSNDEPEIPNESNEYQMIPSECRMPTSRPQWHSV